MIINYIHKLLFVQIIIKKVVSIRSVILSEVEGCNQLGTGFSQFTIKTLSLRVLAKI